MTATTQSSEAGATIGANSTFQLFFCQLDNHTHGIFTPHVAVGRVRRWRRNRASA